MASRRIASEDLLSLQRNLVLSHASGAGKPVEPSLSRAAMLVRLNTLLRGDSGVSTELISHLARCINADLIPLIPEHGGVGASGDLVQLSHIALRIIWEI